MRYTHESLYVSLCYLMFAGILIINNGSPFNIPLLRYDILGYLPCFPEFRLLIVVFFLSFFWKQYVIFVKETFCSINFLCYRGKGMLLFANILIFFLYGMIFKNLFVISRTFFIGQINNILCKRSFYARCCESVKYYIVKGKNIGNM